MTAGVESPNGTNGKSRPRMDLSEHRANAQREAFSSRRINRQVTARYEAAGETNEFKRYWANADALDADSANDRSVRQPLVSRSRYEIQNNGFSAGIAATYANDAVGLGPSLRMASGSENFNLMVEREWESWAKKINLRRKLWTMAHAKHVDGETFGVVRRNPRVEPIPLDLWIVETEQCQTPIIDWEANAIDGIKFDKFGNPTSYDFLKQHPGSSHHVRFDWIPETVSARFVTHWYKVLRPQQHRGVPEMVSTLNCGAAARRWREAVVASAENIADFSLFIKTMFQPENMDSVSPMSTLEIEKRMMTALPQGYDAFQPKAEQPTANHEQFTKSLINEQARPISMPLNKAAADSSDYNYASGRLDHQTYYGALDVDRSDCNEMVLNVIFAVWFENAVVRLGWLGGDPDAINERAKAHMWDWPKHQVADVSAESLANDRRLKNGSINLPKLYTLAGEDYEEQLVVSAQGNGISVDQQRTINLLMNLPQHVIPYVAGMLEIETTSEELAEQVAEQSAQQSQPSGSQSDDQ